MKVIVPNQVTDAEKRVALAPAAVKKLAARQLQVVVQAGAGVGAHFRDGDYEAAGAAIFSGDNQLELWSQADVAVAVAPPTPDQAAAMREGAVFVGVLDPVDRKEVVRRLTERRVTAFALEFLPRTTRAQAMDILSSQANMGGYKAVLLAANHSGKMFPLMMTAAGTIAPAKVFVIGAGVAGLQAIATAKRLGAVVEAFDIRPAVEEQIRSLGGRFVKLDLGAADAETKGGYAKELSPDQLQKQTQLMQKHIIGADCTITTAAIFGKAPPMLVSKDVVGQMRSGTVIIDLAADETHGRGNCELTQPGRCITTDNGVVIDGPTNLPSTLAVDASQAFANNVAAFLGDITKDGQLHLNLEDEIQKGACITHDGRIKNEIVRNALGVSDSSPKNEEDAQGTNAAQQQDATSDEQAG